MEEVDDSVQEQSLASLASSIRKLEKSCVSMQEKGSHTHIAEKRLKAHRIAYAALLEAWNKEPFPYTTKEATDAKTILESLLPSLEAMVPKFADTSSQATLLARRIRSLQLAIQALGEK